MSCVSTEDLTVILLCVSLLYYYYYYEGHLSQQKTLLLFFGFFKGLVLEMEDLKETEELFSYDFFFFVIFLFLFPIFFVRAISRILFNRFPDIFRNGYALSEVCTLMNFF